MCLAVASVCGVGVMPAHAQTAAGEITGLVKDEAGAAVPGATISVIDIRTNLQRVVVSTGDGVYAVPSLAPGEYRLDIELSGFKPVRREGHRQGRWVLLDYSDIVVHVMHSEEREFYALERLWRDCPALALPADVTSGRG